MMEQPESLRLSENLEHQVHRGSYDLERVETMMIEAAAELRRLHKQNDQFAEGIIAATNTINRLHTQRNELLAALRLAARQNSHDMLMTGDELRQCEAAIAKVEGK